MLEIGILWRQAFNVGKDAGVIKMEILNIILLSTANEATNSMASGGNGVGSFSLFLNFMIAIVSAIVGGGVTHFYEGKKLKKEQKLRFEDMVGERVAESLLKIRDIELKASYVEIYNAEEEFRNPNQTFDFLNGGARYLSIFNDWKSYNDFLDSIRFARQNYEKDVDCETAALLVFIERYLCQLSLYMHSFKNEKLLPTLGTIFMCDIQNWQIKFDELLVKKINSHQCKLESHLTKKYQEKRKKLVEEPWKHTLLYLITTGEATNENEQEVLNSLNIFLSIVRNNPEQFIQKDETE